MSRKIIALSFLIFAIFISVFASFKIQSICSIATKKVEKIVEASETDIESAKTQTQEFYEYWQKNGTVLNIFVDAEDTLNVKLSINEMIFLLDENNVEDFLEETAFCKRNLFRITEIAKPSLIKVF